MDTTNRLRAIILALHSRPATAEALAAKFGVTRRTIRRDIQCLRALGLPISGRRGALGEYELAEDYAVQPLPLTGRGAALLLVALRRLEVLPNAPYAADSARLTRQLLSLLPGQPEPALRAYLRLASRRARPAQLTEPSAPPAQLSPPSQR